MQGVEYPLPRVGYPSAKMPAKHAPMRLRRGIVSQSLRLDLIAKHAPMRLRRAFDAHQRFIMDAPPSCVRSTAPGLPR